MIALRQLVGPVPVRHIGLPDDAVVCQEFQCSVHGRLGQSGGGAARFGKDLHGREMAASVPKDVQNSHPLRRHTEAEAPKLWGVF